MTPIENEGTEPVQLQPVGRPPGRFVAAGLIAFLLLAIGLGRWLDTDTRPDPYRASPEEGRAVTPPSSSPLVVPKASTPPARRGTATSPADPEGLGLVAVRPGRFDIPWPDIDISITLPGGWSVSRSGTVVCIAEDEGCRLSLSVHDVTAIAPADVCRSTTERPMPALGPTVDERTAALTALLGPDRPGPTDFAIGGYPAKRFDLSGLVDHCAGGPEGRIILRDASGPPFGVLKGGSGIVYVTDVDGRPVVIATGHRGASAEDVKQLERVVASIEIGSRVAAWDRTGRDTRRIGGVSFGFRADGTWERKGTISLNKSFHGPQGAEAIIWWVGVATDRHATPCVILREAEPTMAGLTAAVATAPGTELLSGPSDVVLGGHAARHVVVAVRERRGCDPGYFFAWGTPFDGAMWERTEAGDRIEVWVVDANGALLFIAAETHRLETAMTQADWTRVDQQIQEIVDSIAFR
ncbi:MAG: hypothetical protein OEV61_00830 [Chloroflexota bacterium]|jgi:hypothetical protein|nr:hypothetical protein [Chloroflexota bacterium]MDH5242502.1 hypothetical protein [Chloroflexota bacterium]